MKITEKEYNVQTGEETISEREETKSEMDLRLTLEAEAVKFEADAAIRTTAKAALLKRLGITADEAALLLA